MTIAETAAKTCDAAVAAVDMARTKQGPIVVDVSAGLAIAEFERLTGVALGDAVIAHIEHVVRLRAGRG
jgi:glutathione synthase/RimK-type ligase-like ATP-grasp enzyme